MSNDTVRKGMEEAIAQMEQAASAKKCWTCGCLHNTLAAIEKGIPEGQSPIALTTAVQMAKHRLADVEYECLGCEVCYPALAINAINSSGNTSVQVDPCPTEKVTEREGWPPLPGAYRVLRFKAPVAVCTLTDESLFNRLAENVGKDVSIIGSLQTENLGIERLVRNVLSNPNVRSLILCGADSRQTVGHLPGQSLLALARSGLDDRNRIIGAKGKRPVIRNLSRQAIERFRETVELLDLIGETNASNVMDAISKCVAQDKASVEPYEAERTVRPIRGYLPARMVSDPAGYFVIYADQTRTMLVLEHYRNDGVLDTIIESPKVAEVYTAAIAKGLVSQLDHAAYLGKELARAEESLRSGCVYVQDAAPEATLAVPSPCGSVSRQEEEKHEANDCCD